jgi:hypothetical protein
MIPISGNNRISPQPMGNMRETLLYPGEKPRKSLEHGSSILFWKFFGFFRYFMVNFCRREQEIGRMASEKIQKFSKTEYCFHAPAIFGVFPLEPARTSSFRCVLTIEEVI